MANYKLVKKSSIKNINSLPSVKTEKQGLSVVIGTFNEGGNIQSLIPKIKENIKKTKYKSKYEIIIVDDNSKDDTPKIIDYLAEKGDIIALHRYSKKGLFTAITDGIHLASYKMILTMDADHSHPPELIPELIKQSEKYDIISGSRFVKGGGMDAPFHRRLGAQSINKVSEIILGVPVKDLGGDFHLFPKDKFKQLELKYPAKFGEFSFEIFYRAMQKGFTIKEVPFVYKKREEGSSKMTNTVKTAAHYIYRAFQIRFDKGQ